uniref:Reverse transcriptase domain-containing protein n=1 Tax=Soboliphyme baturini TaxID=241478 RepID=A0A183J7R5_9BILA
LKLVTPPLPIPSPVQKEGALKTLATLRKIQPPVTHGIDAIENYTGSVVAWVTKGRAGCWRTEADCKKSAIRTCSLLSASRGRSSRTTADEDRRNDDEDTSQQRPSSETDFWCSLERFVAECDATGMLVNASKTKCLVLSRSLIHCSLQINGEAVEQVEKFKYLEIPIAVVTIAEFSLRTKLSVFMSIFIPMLTYGLELWTVTEKLRTRA